MNLLPTPTIEDWRDDKYKELARNSNRYLEIALEEGLLNNEAVIKQGVISDGDSSIVYYVETSEQKYVVKFSPSEGDLVSCKLFFDEWAKHGVTTMKIFKVRAVDKLIPYELASMEFVEAQSISRQYSKIEIYEKGYYAKMGSTLAKMHQAKGEGFGTLIEPGKLVGIYTSLADLLDYDIKERKLDKLIERKYLSEACEEDYYRARDLLTADMAGSSPSLCHNDFLPYNIMATDPITVFDPSPSLSSPLIDLGGSIGKILLEDKAFSRAAAIEMLKAYEEVSGRINIDALNAAIHLSYIRKLPRAIVSGDEDRAKELVSLVEGSGMRYLTL